MKVQYTINVLYLVEQGKLEYKVNFLFHRIRFVSKNGAASKFVQNFMACYNTTLFKITINKRRHAGRARVIFCDLEAPGGCSTRWTHKGNSFMCTGVPDSSQCHYKV